MQIALLLVVKINISRCVLSQLQNRRDSGCISFLKTTCRLRFVQVCLCVVTTSHQTASTCFNEQYSGNKMAKKTKTKKTWTFVSKLLPVCPTCCRGIASHYRFLLDPYISPSCVCILCETIFLKKTEKSVAHGGIFNFPIIGECMKSAPCLWLVNISVKLVERAVIGCWT